MDKVALSVNLSIKFTPGRRPCPCKLKLNPAEIDLVVRGSCKDVTLRS